MQNRKLIVVVFGVSSFCLLQCKEDPETSPKPCETHPGTSKKWEGELGNGNLQLKAALSVAGVGLVYNSIDSFYQEGFGYGWRLNVRASLMRDGNRALITRPDGTPVEFLLNGTAWRPEPQQASSLSYDPQGFFVETFNGGVRYIYRPFGKVHYLAQIVDRNGNTATIHRNDQGQETMLVDEHGVKTTFRWGGTWLHEVEDHEGRIFTLQYNRRGELISITQPDIGAGTPAEKFYYDDQSNHFVVSRLTPAGVITRMTYESDGAVTSITASTGFTKKVTYSRDSVIQELPFGERIVQRFQNGELVSVGNHLDMWVDYQRDNRHRITTMSDSLGHVWTMRYNDNDDMTDQKNPQGQEFALEYDANHNPLSIRRGALTWRYKYDPFDQVTEEMDPRGKITRYLRDERGNLIQVVDSTGKVRLQAEFNPDGSIKKMTDMYGNETNLAYDSFGNLSSMDYPETGGITMRSSPMGYLLEQSNALGDVTTLSYDNRAAMTGYVQKSGSRRATTSATLVRDLDNRVVEAERCGPSGCESSKKEFGATGNVTKDSVNDTPTQDGECPCAKQGP